MADLLHGIDAAGMDAARFHDEIVAAARPVLLRGLVKDWPAVAAAARGDAALADYLRAFDSGRDVEAKIAPPEARGRFFYDADLTGFNFRRDRMTIGAVLDTLLAAAGQREPAALAVQSVRPRRVLPGFARANRLSLLDDAVVPRVWLGNAVTVAAHYDPSDNIAAVVAGRRRFTLFPPDQVGNLYPGSFELTPGGQIVSMVDFDSPDPVRHPRFADAMAVALVADLQPGDALYIPALWWHQVRSSAPLNLLVNYWWSQPAPAYGAPSDALLQAMLAIKNLPPGQRDAWRALFDHFVFQADGPPGEHLPPERRGILGALPPAAGAAYRDALVRSMLPRQDAPDD